MILYKSLSFGTNKKKESKTFPTRTLRVKGELGGSKDMDPLKCCQNEGFDILGLVSQGTPHEGGASLFQVRNAVANVVVDQLKTVLDRRLNELGVFIRNQRHDFSCILETRDCVICRNGR